MIFGRSLPCVLVGLFIALTSANAQDVRPRRVAETISASGVRTLTTDPFSVLLPAVPAPSFKGLTAISLKQLLLSEIDHRLGAPYVYGASGPRSFDCSGFVWSVFQAVGISFERSSARTLWLRFEPVPPGEEYQFGTLVFFNNLTHVGIVADEHGFFHASRSQGVTYSPFNDYWLDRLDGFRRVPAASLQLAE